MAGEQPAAPFTPEQLEWLKANLKVGIASDFSTSEGYDQEIHVSLTLGDDMISRETVILTVPDPSDR